MTAEEHEQARRRLLVLDACMAAVARRSDVVEVIAHAGSPEEAAHAVAELLDVGAVEAQGIVQLRLLSFTQTEMERIRIERDALRERVPRRP